MGGWGRCGVDCPPQLSLQPARMLDPLHCPALPTQPPTAPHSPHSLLPPWEPAEGHVVTNWHVLASVLGGASGLKLAPSAKVARVLLLNGDGVQQAFDGFLVGM